MMLQVFRLGVKTECSIARHTLWSSTVDEHVHVAINN
jgi:hypothetical protein